MVERFGAQRVIEPKGSIPITAWRIDNRKELYSDEIRLKVKIIHLEMDSFQQIGSQCNYDAVKMKARIYDLIRKRGKLHNPFTNSGGILYGMVDEIGSRYENSKHFVVGEEVMVITSLTGIPLYIQEIKNIDFHYGQIEVEGYCILFSGSPLIHRPQDLEINYLLEAFDEAGTIYTISQEVTKGQRFLIIGRDILTIMLYSATVKKGTQHDCYIVGILDQKSVGSFQKKEITEILTDFVDHIYITDIMNPMKAVQNLKRNEKELFDTTIVCEDVQGTETISVLMTKEKGHLFFTSLKNTYNPASLFADLLGKELNTHAPDCFLQMNEVFTNDLLRGMKDSLSKINALFKKTPFRIEKDARRDSSLQVEEVGAIDDFVFISDPAKLMLENAMAIAAYDCNVVIEGEPGVGKDKLLDFLHKNSSRKLYPCVKVSCSSLDENRLEEAFLGTNAGQKGYFELAQNGILFLNDVDYLTFAAQSILLNLLQKNTFCYIGSREEIAANLRVICSCETPLRKLVEQGKFREDLYYALNIYKIDIPPLRERREDIYSLAKNFLVKYNEKYHENKEIAQTGYEKLLQYNWPGNVRELENMIHRLVVYSQDKVITDNEINMMIHENVFDDMLLDLRENLAKEEKIDFEELMELQERRLIELALRREKTTRQAAAFLGISQSKLMRKKQKYGMD